MKMIKKIIILWMSTMLWGCGESFLDIKSNRNDQMPNSIGDYQALMDDAYQVINMKTSHMLGLIAADEIAVDEVNLADFKPYHQRNAYLWVKENFFEGEQSTDWNNAYRRILYCNQVLEGLGKLEVKEGELKEYQQVEGSAYFFRAMSYYQLAQLFCEVYTKDSQNKLGLPLRTEADITLKVKRSNLQETYDFILKDLEKARELLPERTLLRTRPSKAAVVAFLARLYLQFGDYESTEKNALAAMSSFSGEIIDYNLLTRDPNSFDLFAAYNLNHPEVILNTYMFSPEIASIGFLAVSEELLSQYDDSDLRKTLFFKVYNGFNVFVGTYSGFGFPFTGLAIDEIVLILAECEIRKGNRIMALKYLNDLRSKRYVKGTEDYVSESDEDILREVLLERRKELVFRGVRWEDIRRLNRDSQYPVTIQKRNGSELITINPNDSRYVFPIPDLSIELGSLEQNKR